MKLHPFMIREGEQKHITENYVSVPPALILTDEAGNIWTLGFRMGPIAGGEYTFNVLCNGTDTHKYANRIERRKRQIWIFGSSGWEQMQVVKQKPITVYAVGAKFESGIVNGPIHVKIHFDSKEDFPVVSFSFNPVYGGGMEDLSKCPIMCAPEQWLYSIVKPEDAKVKVFGYLGDRNVREIPIRKGDSV